jgi:pimeloyl-ACP methyl ester carboxylesterase
MKRSVLFLIVATMLLFACKSKESKISSIDTLVKVDINGVKQAILIQGKDTTLPIVLFIHGGPGFSSIAESHYYNDSLIKHAVFVHWDQRGAGYSYSKDIDTTTMTLDQFVEDAKEVTKYLENRFKKDKIYVVGHSWGSIIGTKLVQKYPELFKANFVMGMCVNNELNIKSQMDYLTKLFTENKNAEGLKILKKNKSVPTNILWDNKLIFHKNFKYDSISSKSPYFSKEYKAKKDSGATFSHKFLARTFDTINFIKSAKELKVPVYFLQGKFDYTTSSEVVHNYYDLLKAPVKEFIWFDESAHLPNFDEPLKFQMEIIKRLE